MKAKDLLLRYAATYETAAFLDGDPSWFMHQVEGEANQETTAFVAANLSYGSRSQFMPKIGWLMQQADNDFYGWVLSGRFLHDIKDADCCFYRLHTWRQMRLFLSRLQAMLQDYGTLGEYVRESAADGFSAIECLCRWFADSGHMVPRDTQSACKRLCMFLRWMVRDGSPVDLGLWSDFIDRRTLIMPLDTHVVQESMRLGLLHSKTASMSAAIRLTKALATIFPDDPLRGDFALFGYGVNHPTL